MLRAKRPQRRESNTAGMQRRDRSGGRNNLHFNDAFIRRDYNDINKEFDNMEEDPFNSVMQRLAAVSSAENKRRLRVMDMQTQRQDDVEKIGERPAYNRDLDGVKFN